MPVGAPCCQFILHYYTFRRRVTLKPPTEEEEDDEEECNISGKKMVAGVVLGNHITWLYVVNFAVMVSRNAVNFSSHIKITKPNQENSYRLPPLSPFPHSRVKCINIIAKAKGKKEKLLHFSQRHQQQ